MLVYSGVGRVGGHRSYGWFYCFFLHVGLLEAALDSSNLPSEVLDAFILLYGFSFFKGKISGQFFLPVLIPLVFALDFILQTLNNILVLLIFLTNFFILLNFFLKVLLQLLIFLLNFLLVDDLAIVLLKHIGKFPVLINYYLLLDFDLVNFSVFNSLFDFLILGFEILDFLLRLSNYFLQIANHHVLLLS